MIIKAHCSIVSKRTILFAFLFFLFQHHLKAQKEFDGLRGTHNWIGLSDAPNSLYHYLARQAYDYLDKRSAQVAAIHDLPHWKQRQQWIRKTLLDIVGPFPKKTALHANVTSRIHKDGYQVENIIFESQPGYFVTSSLFIPEGLQEGMKAPAIIYCSGHSENGYRAAGYQHEIINLAKKGFIVFAFDPAGQGERLQYFNAKTGKSAFRWPSYEHSYPGAQLFLSGNSLANYFIWDGIRAVDYLLTRKEVDPRRIGITGRSGGGTQSAYIAAFDERIQAVAPENYFTNFTRLYQSMGPQDAEQNFIDGIKRGIDMADLLLVRAPKPALMVTTTQDMFPIQGAIETEKEVSRIYKAYGKPADFRMVSDDAPHASTKKNREAIYAFFRKYLDNPGDTIEVETNPLSPEALQVTATGQVSTSLHGETVFSLNRNASLQQMNKLEAARKNRPQYFANVIHSAKQLSGYREPAIPATRIFAGRIQRDGYVIEKYLVKGEGNYLLPYILLKPSTPARKAIIYLNPSGKAADVHPGGDMEWFVKKGFMVLAPDLVGTGELGPGEFKGDSYVDSVSYNLWFATILIGRSIVGIQAADVVMLTKTLKSENGIQEIYGLAKKQAVPVLLHAAVFCKDIQKLALVEGYASYRSLVMTEHYEADLLHSTVAGAIGVYDLPDLAASLAPRRLLLAGITDAGGENNKASGVEQDISVIRSAYQGRDAGKLEIIPEAHGDKLYACYSNWLED